MRLLTLELALTFLLFFVIMLNLWINSFGRNLRREDSTVGRLVDRLSRYHRAVGLLAFAIYLLIMYLGLRQISIISKICYAFFYPTLGTIGLILFIFMFLGVFKIRFFRRWASLWGAGLAVIVTIILLCSLVTILIKVW